MQGPVPNAVRLVRTFGIPSISPNLNEIDIRDSVNDLFRTKFQKTLQPIAAPIYTPPAAGVYASSGWPTSTAVGSTLKVPVQVAARDTNQIVRLQLGTETPNNIVLNYKLGANFRAMPSFKPTAVRRASRRFAYLRPTTFFRKRRSNKSLHPS